MDTTNERILVAIDSKPTDFIYQVKKSFYLGIDCDRPPAIADVGSRVKLPLSLAIDLLIAKKIWPVSPTIPDKEEYEALIPFCELSNDRYIKVIKGDILTLTKGEALIFIMNQKVRPLDSSVFWPWERIASTKVE